MGVDGLYEDLSRAGVPGSHFVYFENTEGKTILNKKLPEADEAALSIDVEDWFHSDNLRGVISRDAWDRCELHVERNTMRMVEILDRNNIRATFFILGWVAERCPRLVRTIAAQGHEMASHGYGHEHVYSLQPDVFRKDVVRSKKILEDLTGGPVRGYRAPCFSITDWAIPILQEAGYEYDSSAVPCVVHDRYGQLDGMSARKPIVLLRDDFYEVCVSCIQLGKQAFPWGGGGYFRFFPYRVWLRGMRSIMRSGAPYVFYIHPWEIDPGQPRVSGLTFINRFRQRVNLERCEARFNQLVSAYEWRPVCDVIDRWKKNYCAVSLPKQQICDADKLWTGGQVT
jgi:polysaccharide deacetylase family protein (PEP-CTERM system associated)